MKSDFILHPSDFIFRPAGAPLMQSKWSWKSALKWSFPLVCASSLLVGCADSNTSPTKKKTPSQKAEVAAKWNRTRANVMLGLAKDQYNTGNFDASRKTVDEAQRMDEENAPLRVLSARLAIEAGQLELADKELEKARTINPKDA